MIPRIDVLPCGGDDMAAKLSKVNIELSILL